MAVNEEIVTGKKFRRLIDVATNKWRRYSFWNKAKDTECEDGTDVETKVGAIKGITTSTNVSETGYAADAKTVSEINQSLTQLNEGIFKEPIQINYIYNYTSEVQKVFEYECEETGIYVINMSGSDFYTHCFITDKRYAAQIAAMSNNGVATKIQCTNQYKMYKGHKYNIELWNATFQMYKY